MPITEKGHEQARRAGQWIADGGHRVAAVLYGGTRRTRETAEGVLSALGDAAAGVEVADSFALRNPDLYLGGDRVTMVSTAEAFAVQTNSVTAADVLDVDFFRLWLEHPDRVGWWVRHTSPPGDDAASVGRRMDSFARSLTDVPDWRGRTVVAITHSPVLRSVGLALRGTDHGEPAYLNGYTYTLEANGLCVEEVAPPSV